MLTTAIPIHDVWTQLAAPRTVDEMKYTASLTYENGRYQLHTDCLSTACAVKEIQRLTGEPLVKLLERAVAERLWRLRGLDTPERRAAAFEPISALPRLEPLNDLTEDEILGYNEQGLFD